MRVIAWDTETALIRPGVLAPELACVQWSEWAPGLPYDPSQASSYPAHLAGPSEGLQRVKEWLGDPSCVLVGANVAYDLGVIMQADPSLIPLVFQALEQDRITDVQIRQKLLDIAAGCYRGEFKGQYFQVYKYSLEDLTRRLLRWQLSKPKIIEGVNVTPDHWRLRYGELIGVPLAQWPAGAVEYALDDARATLGVYVLQEQHGQFLLDQWRQARRFLALHLQSAYGLRTHLPGVESFASEIEQALTDAETRLQALGLVRANGTRDTKAAARLMVDRCQALGIPVMPTDTAEKKIKAGEPWDPNSLEGIALHADACKRTEDPTLILYADYGVLKAVQSKDLDMLRQGVKYPIHTRFEIVETGRTSSSNPNVQNIRALPGIRECFVPRDGWVYAQADYPGLELKTLAQSCLWLVGYSSLAKVISEGRDPHLMLAASLSHCTYEQAEQAYKADKNWKPRKLAKVANFGFPGGLGFRTFIEYAAGKPYNLHLGEDEARHLKAQWLSTWVEMQDYFNLISQMVEAGHGEAVISHPGSNRIRGRVRYTAACNGFFQGLGADATGEALWQLAKACYVDTSSPLFGCRPVNYVHDEIIAEVPDDHRASPAVLEMCRIMRDAANKWLPDVPFTEIEPCLMAYWSKDAKTIVQDGRVIVWRG